MFCSFWSYIVVHGVPLGVLGPHVEPCIFSALPAARSFPGVPLSAQSNTGCPPWLIHSSLTNRPKHTISLALLHKPARADHELGRNDTLLFLSLPGAQRLTCAHIVVLLNPQDLETTLSDLLVKGHGRSSDFISTYSFLQQCFCLKFIYFRSNYSRGEVYLYKRSL